MATLNGLIKPNTKIFLGIVWFGIAIIYIADRLLNGIDIRLFDWVGWIAMFTAGAISIIEGIRIKKKAILSNINKLEAFALNNQFRRLCLHVMIDNDQIRKLILLL